MVAAQDILKDNPRFVSVCVLESGDRSVLLKAKDKKTRQEVVVKCFPKNLATDDQTKLFRATIIQQYSNHPSLAKFFEISREPTHICIAMEYVKGENLRRFVQKRRTLTQTPIAHLWYLAADASRKRSISCWGLPEDKARTLFCDVVQGIRYLHDKDVCFQLATAEYVVVDEQGTRAKLVNFLSRFGTSLSTNRTMPLPYLSPETWISPDNRNHQFNGKFTDVWSLGVLLFFMLYGEFPFRAKSDDFEDMFKVLKNDVTKFDLKIEEGAGISEECRILITRMLKRNLDSRITLEGIMNTTWFLNGVQKRPIEPPEQNLQSPEEVRRIIDGYDY